jgi:DNA polymerase-3 subunit epsilon
VDWKDTHFLVVDAEMSSLDSAQGELLSLGWVEIREGRIALESAQHLLVKAQQSVGQSATIHHLRDCELETGLPVEEAVKQFLSAARGHVLVFHHVSLDVAYLDKLCLQLFSAPLCMPYLCTMRMEHRRLLRRDRIIGAGDLTLGSCRARYGLPDYPAHNALSDALATGELLLAQASHWSQGKHMSLRQLGVQYS